MPRIAPPTLRHSLPIVLGIASGALAGLIARERNSRRTMERFAAATLETLLNAIDANDADTGAHVRRVAAYAIVLAEEAAVDPHCLRMVEQVALFHDVGKVHEALFDIVHEGSDLSDEEWRAIKTHPRRGAEVLDPVTHFYPDLADGVLSHHERWDGSGYPRGLAGDQIPLAARIVSIADTFDVLSFGRRYQRGLSPRAAAEIVARGRGTQFDPDLVDLFLFPPVFERIVATHRSHRTPRLRKKPERRVGREEPISADVTFRWRTAAPDASAPER
jgi:HD-GYP domain-containing protein (c-di-GMP phosphodiesterase class II)